MYAKHHGITLDEVSEDMLVGSEEGTEHWACKGLNFTGNSKFNQTFKRALKWNAKVQSLLPKISRAHGFGFGLLFVCSLCL